MKRAPLLLAVLVGSAFGVACTGGAEHCTECSFLPTGEGLEAGGGTGGVGADTGAAGVGAVGTAGVTGSAGVGAAGTSGGRGGTGVAGTTATGGTTGRGGTTGAAGTSGAAGTTGTAGTSGAAGTTGGAGASGTGGTTGGAGATGAAGMTGQAGRTGSAGTTASGGTGGTGGTSAPLDPDLVLWYQFTDAAKGPAADSSGHGRSGTLSSVGTGTATIDSTMHVLSISATDSNNGGYLQVPASFQAMGAGTAMTVSMHVYLRTNRVWQRLFDFGNSSSTGYAFLTTQTAAVAAPRFAISKTSNGGAEQAINMNTPALLSTGAWHHVAVVLGAGTTYTGTLYIDHVSVGSNTGMTLRPSDLGNTANNFIGKSQFPDPYVDADIDDFRVYKRALTAAEITALP